MIRNSELWGGLVWLAAGAFIAWSGHEIGIGAVRDPGSGFALFWIGLLMVALSLVILAQGVRAGGPRFGELWARTRIGRVALVMALLVAYAVAFQPVGFVVCTVVLLLILMLVVDPVEPPTAIAVALIAPGAVWWVMTKMLKIQLPSGVLEPWLG